MPLEAPRLAEAVYRRLFETTNAELTTFPPNRRA